MAQGDVLLNADGTVALNGAGLVRLVDVDSDCPDCCGSCTASATSCGNCDDVTPAQYQVTLSGITLCTGCFELSTAFADVLVAYAAGKSSADLNTIHTLTQSGSCDWTKTITGLIVYQADPDRRLGNTCTDFTAVTKNVDIILTRSGTEWTLTVQYSVLGGSPEDNSTLFVDIQTADTDGANQLCATVPSFANDYTISLCGVETGSTYPIAYGGSATVVCV